MFITTTRQPHQNTKTCQPFLAWTTLQYYRYPFIIFITQILPWRRPNIFNQLAVPVLCPRPCPCPNFKILIVRYRAREPVPIIHHKLHKARRFPPLSESSLFSIPPFKSTNQFLLIVLDIVLQPLMDTVEWASVGLYMQHRIQPIKNSDWHALIIF